MFDLSVVRATVEVVDGSPVVVRTGAGDDAAAVRSEARNLAAIAGPGAPRVLTFTDDGHEARLVVTVAPPITLLNTPSDLAFDALARVAEVLARANRAGIGHGPIRDDDVLGDGRSVILAGWQRADADPARDVQEFGRFLERLAVRHRALSTVAARALATDPPTFGALADALRAATPHPSAPRRRLPLRAWLAVLAVVGAIGALAIAATPSHHDVALVLASPSRVSVHGNVVERAGRRWVLGRSGDQVVTGAWHCDGRQLPAVLRPETGRIWVFTAWPAGAAPMLGREATDVPDGVRLHVEHTGRCDHLTVEDDQGRTTVVR